MIKSGVLIYALNGVYKMNNYSTTYGKKIMDCMSNNINYLLSDIDEIEEKEFLIPSIQCNLHNICELELKSSVPREIINKYVNLVFLSFNA